MREITLLIKTPQNVCESVGEGSHYNADRATVPELSVLFNSRPGRPIVSGIRQLVWPQLRWTMLAKTEQGCSYLKQNDHTSLHSARGKIITAAVCNSLTWNQCKKKQLKTSTDCQGWLRFYHVCLFWNVSINRFKARFFIFIDFLSLWGEKNPVWFLFLKVVWTWLIRSQHQKLFKSIKCATQQE